MWRAVGLAVLACACSASAVQTTTTTAAVVTTSDLDEMRPDAPTETTTSPPAGTPASGTSGTGSTTGAAAPVTPTSPDGPLVFGLLDGDMAVEEAWERWRAGKTTSFDAVFEIAVLANRGRPVDMADELMVIALARAVEISGCDPDRLGKIRLLAIAVRSAEHPPELDGELTRLSDTGPSECAKRPQ